MLEQRTGTASQVYRRGDIAGIGELAQNIIDTMGPAFVQRATRGQPTPQRQRSLNGSAHRGAATGTRHAYQPPRSADDAYDTSDDEQLDPRTTGRRQSKAVWQPSPSREGAPETDEDEQLEATTQAPGQGTARFGQHRKSNQAKPVTSAGQDGPITRTTRPPKSMKPSRQAPRRGIHPFIWVGLTMLVLIVLWVIIPVGESWWAVHVSDPGQFGPLHGSIVTGVFGGGDSEAKPSKLIGWNSEGKIRIIMFHGDDPTHSQVLVGPNLASQDWPDPKNAQVELQTRDVDHDGNLDLRVTILATRFDASFQRVQQPYTLYGDGKGNLKPQPLQTSGGAA